MPRRHHDAVAEQFIPSCLKFLICAGNNVHIQDIYRLIGCFRLVMSNGRLCLDRGTVVER